MATTTNYGWTTPDDTALVKDGAAAIRTLGSSVDTTTKNLNPETTLGDIAYRSSTANVKTRLGIGSTGQVLTVAAGVPSWATPAAGGGMTLINSGGTTLTGASVTIGSIPATYKNLVVFVRNFRPANDGDDLLMRFNADSTANRYFSTGNNTEGTGAFDAAQITGISNQVDNGASSGFAALTIYDYTNTTTWKTGIGDAINTSYSDTAQVKSWRRFYAYNQTGAISSLVFFATTGNFTSGDVFVYGVS